MLYKPDFKTDELVIQNKYYPIGLKKSQIYNYYMENKDKILKEYNRQPVLMLVNTELNNTVIIRKYRSAPIILNQKNYEFFLYKGRTISFSVETPDPTDYIIVDIDYDSSVPKTTYTKYITICINLLNKLKIVKTVEVYSSANSFHVYGFLNKKHKKEKLIEIMNDLFKELKDDKHVVINNTRKQRNQINFDYSPMMEMGSHTLFNCLCKNGLKYEEVTKTYKSLNKESLVIERQIFRELEIV